MRWDKTNFIKENGICFGCLKVGHISKDCRSRLDCSVCHQKHPSVLSPVKDISTSFREAQESVSPPLSVSPRRGHIGAGDEDNAVFSIVAVQVKSQMSNKVVQVHSALSNRHRDWA